MQRFLLSLLVVAVLPLSALAQTQPPVPDRRLVVTRDLDFFGSDLQALFDTTLQACQAVCLNDPACRAFTFNSRSNACFPKTDVTDRQPYDGAVSGQVIETDPRVLVDARDRAAELGFLPERDFDAAREQAQTLAVRHGGGEWGVDALLDSARQSEAQGNLRDAVHWTGAATAQADRAELWLDYARLSLAHADAIRDREQNRYRQRGLSAGVNAYLRATGAAQRQNVLLTLARALEVTGRGRDTVPALRLAQSLGPRDDVTAALDDAIAKYGFRITGTEVTSDSADPRICAQFSDPLVRAGTDYAPYVRLPDERLSVEVDETSLCISGLSHGERYAATFRAGLPAASGESLVRDVPITAYIRDRSPAVAFPGRGYVLPRSTDAGLPVETVNTDRLDLRLLRVSDRNLIRAMQESYFGRPLAGYARDRLADDMAEEVWRGTAEVANTLNTDMLTRLPMGPVVAALEPGIYALLADLPEVDARDEAGATQWFILSDIGLTTLLGEDGLTVAARGLSDARALDGLTLQLVSQANRVLAEATTDADGIAVFPAGLTRGTGGAAPALVMARRGDSDIAFLSLTDPAFDLSDRGVAGREPAGPIDTFLATDRGAYRAGETIHATALMRDAAALALEDVPLTAILRRPDGVEHRRIVSDSDAAGGHVFALPLSPSVPRGTWRLSVHADVDAPAMASRTLLVEDFVPEKIDFDLTLPDGAIDPLSPPLLGVSARYLFGAPGADLPIEGTVGLVPRSTIAALPGYVFGRHDERPDAVTRPFPPNLRTDAAGQADLALPLGDASIEGQPFEAQVTLRLSEGSGRPVERSIARPVLPAGPVIGIRPDFDGTLPEGGTAGFRLLAVGPDLQPVPMNVRWQINRVETRYQWYQLYGNWNWEPVTTRTPIARGEAILGAEPLALEAAVEWRRYELVVERTDGTYVASSIGFDAGWYAPADAAQTPDTLELSLDREAYAPGETARLRIVPRYPGKAVISVLADRVIALRTVDVGAGETLVDLPVTDDWGTGVYVTAQVIRPMDAAAGQNPARALGLAHAAVDPGDQRLAVALDAPADIRPRGPLTVPIRVSGQAEGDSVYVTLAAVDLGILNLTGFDSPDPEGHYFGQRRLGVELRDIYGRLIDGMNGAMGQVRSGGDAGAQMRLQSPPPTEALAAFFSGPVALGPDGRAEVTFDLPDFNGTLRLMAIAWSPRAVGQAEAEVLVRDPVVLSAATPRFLAPGDESRVLLEITHASGPEGPVALDLAADGLTLDLDGLPESIPLAAGETARLTVPLRAETVGDHALRIALTTPDGQVLTKRLTLGVRANDPPIGTTRRFALAPGETFTLDRAVLSGFRPGDSSVTVSAGPLARFDVPGLMASLDRYPYGCTEQITSQTLPLLYLSSLAEPLGLGDADRIAARIGDAVTRILTRQAGNGGFGTWSAGSGDLWLAAYVTDFLARARAGGHEVPERAFASALDHLANAVAYAPDFDRGGEDIAYALMVLAREGRAAMGDLRYYADEKAAAFATPLALAQMGAALAQYGDQMRADRLFARAAERIAGQQGGARGWRSDYGSPLRDAAGLLSLAVEARSDAVDRDALGRRIAVATRPLSTQEQSWALLAAHAVVTDPTVSGLSVDGAPVAGPFLRRIDGADLRPMTLTNQAQTPTDITLTTLGVPEGDTAASGYGYAIERAYFTPDGAPLNGSVRVGDRFVTVLTVRPAEPTRARLIVDDPLPAGFEIDNPTLLRAGDIRALDWLDPAPVDHAEFRTDRFLAALEREGDAPFRLAYIVRAVSPGHFHHPAALVEDMYRPDYRATNASARLTILP